MSQPNEFLTLMALDEANTFHDAKQTLVSVNKRQISFIREVDATSYPAFERTPPTVTQVVVLMGASETSFYTKESRASLINRMMWNEDLEDIPQARTDGFMSVDMRDEHVEQKLDD